MGVLLRGGSSCGVMIWGCEHGTQNMLSSRTMSAGLIGLAAAVGLAVLAIAVSVTPAVADGLTLKVRIDGFKSESGQVFICLWEATDNFPKCEAGNSSKRIAVKIINGVAEASFSGLMDGKRYAVSAHHDENGNGKIDKTAMGIALEGIGISGNPSFSPLAISFSKNSFVMTPKLSLVPIHIKYMF